MSTLTALIEQLNSLDHKKNDSVNTKHIAEIVTKALETMDEQLKVVKSRVDHVYFNQTEK